MQELNEKKHLQQGLIVSQEISQFPQTT